MREALEEYRDGNHDEPINKALIFDGKPEGFPIEIADTIIRIFDLCGYLDIDLEEAIRLKMEYNKTRSYRHGNKKA